MDLRFSWMEKFDEEIAEMKQLYPIHWVTRDSDDPSIITVLVKPCVHLNIKLKIEVTPQYPESVPHFSVISDCLTKSNMNHLQRLLELKSIELKGHSSILSLLKETEQFIETSGLLNFEGRKSGPRTKKSMQKNDRVDVLSHLEASAQTTCEAKLHESDSFVSKKHKQKKSKRKKKRKEYDPEDDSQEDINDMEEQEQGVQESGVMFHASFCDPDDRLCKRPTHFIAVRILDEDIVQGLEEVQQQLVEKEPLLEKGIFAGETFHLTLCTLGLDTPEAVTDCISSLARIESDLKPVVPRTPLTVFSMSQFYNRAIYAKVNCGEDFIEFRYLLRKKLLESGVEIRDEHRSFTPHLTVIKVKRPERRLFGCRNIKPSIYSHVLDRTFGHEQVRALYLCSMDGQRREDGFYSALYELHF